MARVGAVTVLLLALLGLVLASSQVVAGAGDDSSRVASTRAYPRLRAVSELDSPGPGLVFPGPAAVRAARSYAARRQGRVSFAVGDADGDISGLGFDQVYLSASLVKAMILVAYLERAERNGQGVSTQEVAWLDGMIRVSDNYSASQLFHRLGPQALRNVARRAGLKSFSVGDDWGSAHVTAADQVRFFLAIDRLLPAKRRRDYARYLLSNVAFFHSWGIPAAARPRGWQVYFKGGWRPDSSGQLVHQAALLERGPRRLAIAVLTDGSRSETYAHDTIRGIAQRLLGHAAESGVLLPIKSLG